MLEVFAVREPGRMRAVAPVQRKPGGFGATSPTWQSIVADDDESAEAVAKAIVNRGGERMALQFGFPGTRGLEAFQWQAGAAGYQTAVIPSLRSPFILVRGCFSDYLAQRSRFEVRELQRRRRQLERLGPLTFEIHDGSAGLESLLREGFAVQDEDEMMDAGPASLSRPESLRYYTALARWAAEEGLLRLAFLRLAGRPIAFTLMMEDDCRLYTIKGGYARYLSRSRPGFLALLELVRQTFTREMRTIELLGNDEPWKRLWSHGVHERVTLVVIAPGSDSGRFGSSLIGCRSSA